MSSVNGPFVCPVCGTYDETMNRHDYGQCFRCLKQERDTLLQESVHQGEYMEGLLADHEDIVNELRRKLDARQAKIDALMLEYCPDEMSAEQKARWSKHQVPGNG